MTSAHVALLGIQFAVSCTVLLFIAGIAVAEREHRHAYRLYALRDQLLYLLASQKIAESDPLFKTFYAAISSSISELGSITVYALVKASISAKTTLEKAQREELSSAIRSASPEVREFIAQFSISMMKVMLANSPELNVVLFAIRWCGRALRWLRRFILPDSVNEAYVAYQYFKNIETLAHC